MSVDKSPNLYSEGFSFVRRDNKKALSTCPSCRENCMGYWDVKHSVSRLEAVIAQLRGPSRAVT